MAPDFKYHPDDMLGTIAVDGLKGLLMSDDFHPPREGYYTVGLEICHSQKDDESEPSLLVNLLAVDADVMRSRSPDSNDPLPVFRFKTNLTIADLLAKASRIRIVLQDESTRGWDLAILNWKE